MAEPSIAPPVKAPWSRRRKWCAWLLGLAGLLLSLLVVLLLSRDVIFRTMARRSIERSTGLRTELGELKTHLGSSALQLRHLKLHNPIEFGASLMLHVAEFGVAIDPQQLTTGRLHFTELKLDLPELNIVKDAQGRSNWDGVEKALREYMAQNPSKDQLEFAGIDRVELTLGRVTFQDLRPPARTNVIELAVQHQVLTNLATVEDVQTQFGALALRLLMQSAFQQSNHPETNKP